MNSPLKFSLELLVSTYKFCNYIDAAIPEDVFIWFLELSGEAKIHELSVRKDLNRIKKADFEKKYDIDQIRKSFKNKSRILVSHFNKIDYINEYQVYLSDLLINKYGILYQNYLDKTNYSRNRAIIVHKLSLDNLNEIYEMIRVTAEEVIKLQVLRDVEKYLNFKDQYLFEASNSSNDDNENKELVEKVVVAMATDACNRELRKNPDMTVEELIEVINKKYEILHYKNDRQPEENERNKKKAIRINHKRFQDNR